MAFAAGDVRQHCVNTPLELPTNPLLLLSRRPEVQLMGTHAHRPEQYAVFDWTKGSSPARFAKLQRGVEGARKRILGQEQFILCEIGVDACENSKGEHSATFLRP
jgi:hypothetical protein